jgi:hypothetical protein
VTNQRLTEKFLLTVINKQHFGRSTKVGNRFPWNQLDPTSNIPKPSTVHNQANDFLEKILKSSEYSDVELEAKDGLVIKAHKVILSSNFL